MKHILLIVAACLLSWPFAVGAPPDKAGSAQKTKASKSAKTAQKARITKRARAVLEQAIESMGGDAALAKIKGFRMLARGMYKMGEHPSPYTTETICAMPNRLVWKLDAGGMKFGMGLDGDTAWSSMMCPPARVSGKVKQMLLDWPAQYDMMFIRPLLHRKGVKITGGKKEEKDGKTFHKVRVQFRKDFAYTMTFVEEGKRLHLSALTGNMILMDGRDGRMEARLSKPKAFGGITFPSVARTLTFIGKKPLETINEEITAIEWNPKVPADAFRVPKYPVPLMTAGVKDVPEFTGLYLLHKGSYDGLNDTIGRLMTAAIDAGLMQMGGLTMIPLNSPDDVEDPANLRTEVYLPVMVPPQEKLTVGDATLKDVTSAMVASMTAKGPYGKADEEALEQTFGWIEKNGYVPVGSPRILYHHNPETTLAEDMISEVQVPVRRK